MTNMQQNVTGLPREHYEANIQRLQAGEKVLVSDKHGVVSELYLKDGKMYDTLRNSREDDSDPEVIPLDTLPITCFWSELVNKFGAPVKVHEATGTVVFQKPDGKVVMYHSAMEDMTRENKDLILYTNCTFVSDIDDEIYETDVL
ncbi:hypothetical protein HK097_003123 [Rhizophlyctis rosea]|uniref:Uncharacterized protein n=1 Tax=Rhizophlyctis rosea TaxID=64517 RepID=A0AAD5S3Z9_9FUNG|nr:hypothetical protein HK097_003123 [Rhizophlyctis rosea]